MARGRDDAMSKMVFFILHTFDTIQLTSLSVVPFTLLWTFLDARLDVQIEVEIIIVGQCALG